MTDTVCFAHWEAFWIEARWIWEFILGHEHYPDCNERLENHMPCSDKPMFWSAMIMPEGQE